MKKVDKFATVNHLPQIMGRLPSVNWSKSLNMVVVYCVWSKPDYAKFLRMSLYSQFKYTDFTDCCCVIFTDEQCREAVEAITPRQIVVETLAESFTKYSILNHPAVAGYDYICLVDCDTFFYYDNGKFPLYRRLLSVPTADMLMLPSKTDAKFTFYYRSELTIPRIEDHKEYRLKWGEILRADPDQYFRRKTWFFSCFAPMKNMFQNEKYKRMAEKAMNMQTVCDESVLLLYAWQNGFTVDSVESVSKIKVLQNEMTAMEMLAPPKNQMLVIHPLAGSFAANPQNKFIYRKLVSG